MPSPSLPLQCKQMFHNNFGTDEQKKKKIKIIIFAGAAFLLIILAIIIGVAGTKAHSKNSRENILKLAQTYAERGEFERALNKLDSYLEKNSDDEDIWGLWNLIIDMKKAVEYIDGRAIVEASGNVTLDTINAIAATGVDIISTSAMQAKAGTLDLGLDV